MKASLIAQIFIFLVELSAKLKLSLWKFLYNYLAKKDKYGDLNLMNYGYVKFNDNEFQLELLEVDENFLYPIQLYCHVLHNIPNIEHIAQKAILEVGCGRGGGANFILNYYKPKSYIGIDLSINAITWCQNQYKFNNAHWIQGSALNLPIENNSVDIVINVESSHCYSNMSQFLQQVWRVLKNEGYFSFCDLRTKEGLRILQQQLNETQFKIIKFNIITPQIIQALNKTSEQKETHIISKFPKFLQQAIKDFMGIKGSAIYNQFASGEMVYISCVLYKD